LHRAIALLPPLLAGFALALSCSDEAAASGPSAGSSGRAGSERRAQRGQALPVHANIGALTHTHRYFPVLEGALRAPSERASCPTAMANVDDRFCIDRWEASLVEVLSDGQEQSWPPFGALEGGHSLRAVSRPNVYPQAYISGAQAEQACEAAGKRLCAPVEWRKACRGPREQTFGYGNARVAGRCNDQGRSPMMRLFPQVATSWQLVGMTEMNDPRLNQLDGTLAQTGSHEECTNEYGVYDMVGNLHEWTSDPNGTFQGGYYLDTHQNGDGCSYRTAAHEFTYHDYSTGFRCCADPASP
jgi:sulfatase modifying factor 1